MIYPRTKLDLEIDVQKKRGILLVISGPSSGAGKDSVLSTTQNSANEFDWICAASSELVWNGIYMELGSFAPVSGALSDFPTCVHFYLAPHGGGCHPAIPPPPHASPL